MKDCNRKNVSTPVRKISDPLTELLLWRFIKAGYIERNLFCAASQGVPQGGVTSPLLSNIMLNKFDHYLDKCYLRKKARKGFRPLMTLVGLHNVGVRFFEEGSVFLNIVNFISNCLRNN